MLRRLIVGRDACSDARGMLIAVFYSMCCVTPPDPFRKYHVVSAVCEVAPMIDGTLRCLAGGKVLRCAQFTGGTGWVVGPA